MKLCIAVVVATFLTVSAASSGRLLKNEERINYPVCERQTLLQLKRTILTSCIPRSMADDVCNHHCGEDCELSMCISENCLSRLPRGHIGRNRASKMKPYINCVKSRCLADIRDECGIDKTIQSDAVLKRKMQTCIHNLQCQCFSCIRQGSRRREDVHCTTYTHITTDEERQCHCIIESMPGCRKNANGDYVGKHDHSLHDHHHHH